MLKLKYFDKKALTILKKYNVLAEGDIVRGFSLNEWETKYVKEHCISEEERDILNKNGLGFGFVATTHDQALEKCFSLFKTIEKDHVVASFLSSLSSARLDYRSGLSAFAIMQTMPRHTFSPNQASFCKICSATQEKNIWI
ncbi:hypothetical protein ITK37_001814 [Salmonella enterica]|nr:hypothetical protein [Salmonella enterica]